jgi:DNA transformation protein
VSVSKALEAHILEQLEAVGAVSSRRMFGGVGIYIDEIFCVLISPGSGGLYFKVDDSNRADYEARGSKPFMPYKDRATILSYYQVPEEVIEDPEELLSWAKKARAAALAAPGKAGKGR